MKRLCLFFLFCLASLQNQAQTDSSQMKEPAYSDTTLIHKDWKSINASHYELNEDGICRHRLIKNTGVVMAASLLTFGMLYMLPEESTSWHKDEMSFTSLTEQWHENVAAGPVWDDDGAFFNYVLHPYCGGVFYMGARGAGYKIFPSFLYSAAMSTVFWEYGIEAFAEVPSIQDLIVTPVAGSFVGEGFFALKKNIKSNDDRLFGTRVAGIATMWLIDPLNQMVDVFEGDRCKNIFTTSGIFLPAGKQSYFSFSFTMKLGRSQKSEVRSQGALKTITCY